MVDAPNNDKTDLQKSQNSGEEASEHFARIIENGSKALYSYLEPYQNAEAGTRVAKRFDMLSSVFQNVAESWKDNPQAATQTQTDYLTQCFTLWGDFIKQINGEETTNTLKAVTKDKRYEDPMWDNIAWFSFLKQFHQISGNWIEQLVKDAPDVDPEIRHKASFFLTQIIEATSPANFAMTNPVVINEAIKTNGKSLADGLEKLAEDISLGGGELKIRQTAPDMFEVGKDLAITEGSVIFENEVMQLIQYKPTTETVYDIPVVISPPWINKYYILDLTKEKSFVQWMVDQGHTVFMISWVNADETTRDIGFEDYMRSGIVKAIDIATEICGTEKAHTMGYCVGGTMLAFSAAYMAATGNEKIASTSFLTTQVDFTHAGDLKAFVDESQVSTLEEEMEQVGYLSSHQMSGAFNMLRARDMIWPYFINAYLIGKDPRPFDLLHWNSDATCIPHKNHSYYIRNFYLENKLVNKLLEVDGFTLDLEKVKTPVYSLATKEDHIAPAKSVFLGTQFFGGDVTFVLSGSGHIAGVVNPPHKNKYQYWTGGKPTGSLDEWAANTKEHPGSWWHNWHEWILAVNDDMVSPREIGSKTYPAIENAPGSYVKKKS